MIHEEQHLLDQIREVKVDPISVVDIEGYFKKYAPDRFNVKPAFPDEQDLESLHEAYDITPSAARRYLALSGEGFSTEYSGELATIQNQKVEAKLLSMAKGDPVLADVFLKLYHGSYGRLGEKFILRPALHWSGFIVAIIFMFGAFVWAFLDTVLGLNQLEWWQRVIFLIATPAVLLYAIKEHQQVMKLIAYSKGANG